MRVLALFMLCGCLHTPLGSCATDADCAGGPPGLFCAEGVCQAPPRGAIDAVPAAAVARSAVAEVRAHVERAHGTPTASLLLGSGEVAGEALGGGSFRFAVPASLAPAGVEGPVAFRVRLVDDLGHASELDGALVVDDRAPRISVDALSVPAAAVTRGTDVAVRVRAEDLTAVALTSSSGALVAGSDGWMVAHVDTAAAPPAVTSESVTFTATDAVGNVSTASVAIPITRLAWRTQHNGTIDIRSLALSSTLVAVTTATSLWLLDRKGNVVAETPQTAVPIAWPATDGTNFWITRTDDNLCKYDSSGNQLWCCGTYTRLANGPALLDEFAIVETAGTQPSGKRFYATSSASECNAASQASADFDVAAPAIGPYGDVYSGAYNAIIRDTFDTFSWSAPPSVTSTSARYIDQPAFRKTSSGFDVVLSEVTGSIEVSGQVISVTNAAASLTAPTIAADQTIFVGTNPAGLVAVRPDGTIWHVTPSDAPTAPPTQGAGNVVYVGTLTGMIEARSATDGALIWQYDAGSAIRGALAPGCDGLLYAATQSGAVLTLVTDAKGLADSAWPKAGHDVRNTGDARRPLSANGACLE